MNYGRFLTRISASRRSSAIMTLAKILMEAPPSMISMAGGLPNPDLFPFQSAQIKLKDGTCLNIDDKAMNKALQYDVPSGMMELVDFLKKLQKEVHNPPTMNDGSNNLDVCVTSGSQEGIAKSIDMLVNHGDNVLIEAPTFAGAIDALRPYGCKLLNCEVDKDGLIPDAVLKHLSKWKIQDSKKLKSDIPKILYTVPNGGNPSGSSTSAKRRKQIYEIAQTYDLIIMEDDPYYFVQYIDQKAPSYLSLDEDGRVLRFDSLSKILSSGLRLGYVSGAKPFVEKITQHIMVSTQHASMMSQVTAYQLLNYWGIEKFLKHVHKVTEYYAVQKDCTLKAANKWLKGKAEWYEPKAGMFLWMKLIGVEDTYDLIMTKAFEKEVFFVPGREFIPGYNGEPCPYIRASFSLASPENIEKGIQRLAECIEEHWKETGYVPKI